MGRKVRLRLLEESDLPLTLIWRNRHEIRKWFVHSALITGEQHRAWFRKYLELDNDYVFIIEHTANNFVAVGQASIYNIDWEHGQAEFGRLLIGPSNARRHGLAKESVKLLLKHAHDQLGIGEFDLEVFRDNFPALAIYESLGFAIQSQESNLVRMRLVGSPRGSRL